MPKETSVGDPSVEEEVGVAEAEEEDVEAEAEVMDEAEDVAVVVDQSNSTELIYLTLLDALLTTKCKDLDLLDSVF